LYGLLFRLFSDFPANLIGANLNDARLNGANLSGANLTDAKNVKQSQLDQACGVNATLPAGLTLEPCPPQPSVPPPSPK
jgi:uncharacterized protein YjbI with pentapeptide repeats